MQEKKEDVNKKQHFLQLLGFLFVKDHKIDSQRNIKTSLNLMQFCGLHTFTIIFTKLEITEGIKYKIRIKQVLLKYEKVWGIKHETMTTTFMRENTQETSSSLLSLVPVIDNLSKRLFRNRKFLKIQNDRIQLQNIFCHFVVRKYKMTKYKLTVKYND